MIHGSRFSALLSHYWVAAVAVIVASSLAAWPWILAPLAHAYARFCARLLASGLLLHRVPPYVSATIVAGALAMALTAALLVARQFIGQRHLVLTAMAHRRPHVAHLEAVAARAGLSGRLVVTQDRRAYAFCAGFHVPRVYVSEGLLDLLTPAEIEAVLRHEARHLQQRDPLRLFLVNLLSVLLSPFPAIGAWIERTRIRMELAADEAALEELPVTVLASALIKVARAFSGSAQHSVAAGLTPTGARIDALLGRPVVVPFRRSDLLVTGFVLLALLGMFAQLAAVPPPMAHLCPACRPF